MFLHNTSPPCHARRRDSWHWAGQHIRCFPTRPFPPDRGRMPAVLRFAVNFAIAVTVAMCSFARGQDRDGEPLRLQEVAPPGVRTTLTERWGTLSFTVINRHSAGRDARLLASFPEQPDVQYGRDFWVPAGSSLTSWIALGPAPKQTLSNGRNLEVLLFDRTAGQDRLVLPPTEERTRVRTVPYRTREPTTAILLDDAQSPERSEALMLARALRHASNLSEAVAVVPDGFLPADPAAFDGIDHFILAGNRLSADPPGLDALRQWVQHGGKLWVTLDLVEPALIAGLLGEDVGFQIVDRVGLTTIALNRATGEPVEVP